MTAYNNSIFPTQQPTVTAGAYSANDVVGGLLTFACGVPNGNVFIHRLQLGDADNEKAAMDLWFFKSSPATVLADNAAFSTISDADIRDKCLIHIALAATDYTTAGSNATGEKMIERSIPCDSLGNFYVYAVFVGAPTLGATTDYRFTFEVWPDAE